MPIYVYACESCGKSTDQVRPVAHRNDPLDCPFCGHATHLEVQPVGFDCGGGTDPGFPTAYDRWAKRHTRKEG